MSSSSARALRILDEIARSDHPLSVTEIARALALPPGTVFRSVDALLRTGLAARYQASARYIAGPAAERLQRSVIARFGVREICLPWLRQIASISGETVSLHVRIGWNEVRICSVPGTDEMMTLPPLGEIRPLSESCAGQVILAFLPKAEITAYVSYHLRPVLNRIRSRGYAAAAAEHPSTAFPIRTDGQAIAVVSIDGPFAASALRDCRQVIGNIEALAAAQPSLFANPFGHLSGFASEGYNRVTTGRKI
jgi:DNA-binding IclR family transcriptional regulator